MKAIPFLIPIIFFFGGDAFSQEAGSIVYGTPKQRSSSVTTTSLSATEPKGSVPVSFVEANVLMNVKADEYIAVFALAQEGPTLPDGNQKLSAQINQFITGLENLGIKTNDLFVDFIAQNRIYDFTVADNSARESLSGFEVKKNLAIRYRDRGLLDRMLE